MQRLECGPLLGWGGGQPKQWPWFILFYTLTRGLAKSIHELELITFAEIRVGRIDPGVAATGVKEEAELLGGGADLEFRVVATAGDVVESVEREGLVTVVALETEMFAAKLLARERDRDMGRCQGGYEPQQRCRLS